jgi:hypothetical protein
LTATTGTSFRRIEWTLMADGNPESSEPPSDPPAAAPDSEADESPPPDDSFLLGATGVEAEVLAELARAEASLHDPTGAADESDGAVV